jgi:hypothetical protein
MTAEDLKRCFDEGPMNPFRIRVVILMLLR